MAKIYQNMSIEKIDEQIANMESVIEYFKRLRKQVIKSQTMLAKIQSKSTNVLSDTEEIIINTNALIYTDEEKWVDIKMYGIDFNYQVSNHSNVKNKLTNKFMSQNLRDGYKSVTLCYTNDKSETIKKAIKVHRLVAFGFVKNDDPINKNIVNHLDGNKLNNHWTNFEWTTLSENNQHAINTGLNKATKRRVTQYDLDMNLIQIFESLDQAGKTTKTDDGAIAKVCKGKRNTADGFKWAYTDVNTNEVELSEMILKDSFQ